MQLLLAILPFVLSASARPTNHYDPAPSAPSAPLVPSVATTVPAVPLSTGTPGGAQTYSPVDASSTYPHASGLGASIEGASVDAQGNIYAVNRTHLINLKNGEALYSNTAVNETQQYFASSRCSKAHGFLLGDAAGHKVYNIPSESGAPKPFVSEPKMLQPNDMAIGTVAGGREVFYFSGMKYAEGRGDLWYRTADGAVKNVDIAGTGIGRTNGIEVSPCGQRLFVTSAEHISATNTTIKGAKIYQFQLNPSTGEPTGKPTVAIDLYKDVPGAEAAQMDPDGMRVDVKGYMYSTLNAYGKVLRWNTDNPKEQQVIDLKTIGNPTNLEMGGADGKTLVVVGVCKEDKKASCVESVQVPNAGKAWTSLQGGSKGMEDKGKAPKGY